MPSWRLAPERGRVLLASGEHDSRGGFLSADRSASYRVVNETDCRHLARVVKIAPVNDDGTLQSSLEAVEIGMAVFIPISDYDKRISTIERFIPRFGVGDLATRSSEPTSRLVQRGWVMRANRSSPTEQLLNQYQRRRFAHV